MSEIYRFKVEVEGFEDVVWREIEISSNVTIGKFAYSVIASLGWLGGRSFAIRYKNKLFKNITRYEDRFYFLYKDGISVLRTKISKLKIELDDILIMNYGSKNGWKVKITLLSTEQMEKGKGRRYPLVLDGQGGAMYDFMAPKELRELIDNFDRENPSEEIIKKYGKEKSEHDYTELDLKDLKKYYKEDIADLKYIYEEIGM